MTEPRFEHKVLLFFSGSVKTEPYNIIVIYSLPFTGSAPTTVSKPLFTLNFMS